MPWRGMEIPPWKGGSGNIQQKQEKGEIISQHLSQPKMDSALASSRNESSSRRMPLQRHAAAILLVIADKNGDILLWQKRLSGGIRPCRQSCLEMDVLVRPEKGKTMKFALIDNKRVEAEPKLKGLCPGCGQPVIPKCGNIKVHHWAHQNKKMCDQWWEPETEWHRAWKNRFPDDWQEFRLHDKETSEYHIADIRTDHGIVIEFQHSHIDPQERVKRERFYQNMVWVVDGTRLKRDFLRFIKGMENWQPTKAQGYFSVNFPDECFPADWRESSKPVIFDFRGRNPSIEQKDAIRLPLWCLLPGRIRKQAVLMCISREQFVEKMSEHSESLWKSFYEVSSFIINFQQQQRDLELAVLRKQSWQKKGRQRRL